MLPNISTATVHRWGTGHKRCPARALRTNVPPYACKEGRYIYRKDVLFVQLYKLNILRFHVTGATTSGFEITSMILTLCQTQPIRLPPVPKVALSSPLDSGYWMFRDRVEVS